MGRSPCGRLHNLEDWKNQSKSQVKGIGMVDQHAGASTAKTGVSRCKGWTYLWTLSCPRQITASIAPFSMLALSHLEHNGQEMVSRDRDPHRLKPWFGTATLK